MLIDTTLLSETERRFAERQRTREEGVRLIRAGNLLQADSPERVQARLKRLGIDRRVAERVAGTQTGLCNEAKRRIADSAELAKAPGETEQKKVYRVMSEDLLRNLIPQKILSLPQTAFFLWMVTSLKSMR